MSAGHARASVARFRPNRRPHWINGRRVILPPGGAAWMRYRGRSGPFVAFGPGAQALALHRLGAYPVLWLPEGDDPLSYYWPLKDLDTVVIESGSFDTARLETIVYALFRDGVPMVRPIREALLAETPPRSWVTYFRDEYERRRHGR
jgi:hypothetical protein